MKKGEYKITIRSKNFVDKFFVTEELLNQGKYPELVLMKRLEKVKKAEESFKD